MTRAQCLFWKDAQLFLIRGKVVRPTKVMMAIDGIGVWGADAIVGEDEGGMSESDADLRLILCVFLVFSATCVFAP